MDSHMYEIFLYELKKQCDFATIAHNDLVSALECADIKKFWYSLQSFLIATANISKIFWPDKQGNQKRGEELRQGLDIKDGFSSKIREPRNHFEHFDERLDTWLLSHSNIFDSNISDEPLKDSMGPHLRYFDSRNYVFYYRDKQYPIKPIMDLITDLSSKVGKYIPY